MHSSNSIHGIDVSGYQTNVDWAAVKESGLVGFVYAKATEGLHETDDQFARNAQVCAERQIPFGAYHFFHPEEDGEAQARHFMQTVAMPKIGQLLPMVDVEIDSGCSAQQIVTQLARFTHYCESVLNHRLVIYTDLGFWNGSVNGSDAFSGHPLWIAEYNSDAAPTLPGGWNTWAIWQYTSSATVPGISGQVDMDILNPSLALKSISL